MYKFYYTHRQIIFLLALLYINSFMLFTQRSRGSFLCFSVRIIFPQQDWEQNRVVKQFTLWYNKTSKMVPGQLQCLPQA